MHNPNPNSKFINQSPSHKMSSSIKNGDAFNNTISTIPLAQPNSPLSSSQISLFTTDELDRLNNFYEELTLEKEAIKLQMNSNESEITTLSKKLLQANDQKEMLHKAQQRISQLENRMVELAQERDGSNSRRNANGERSVSAVQNINIEAANFSQKVKNQVMVTPEPEPQQESEQVSVQESEKSSLFSPEEEPRDLKEKLEELSNRLNKSEESKKSLWEIIENKDNLIRQLESHIEGLKLSYTPLLDDLKKKLLTFSSKNQELSLSLQEKVNEITKLKENMNDTDFFKQQLLITTQKNEGLQREILNMRDQNFKLESIIKTKDIELEQKEKDSSLTLEKYNNLQMIVKQSAQENQAYKNSLQQLEIQYSNLRETLVTSPRTPVKGRISTPVSKEKEAKELKDIKAKISKVEELEKKIVVLSARKDKLTKENNELTNIITKKRQQQAAVAASLNKAKQTSTRSCSSKDDLDHHPQKHHQLNVSQLITEWDDEEAKEVYQYRLSKISTCSDSNISLKEKSNPKNAGENIKKLDSAMDRLKDVERKLVAIINKTATLKFEGKSKKLRDSVAKKSMIMEDWKESFNELQQIFSEMGEGDEQSKSTIPNFEAVCGSVKSIHDDSFVVFSGSNSLEAL